MRTMQARAYRDKAEEELIVWLKAKSPEELRQFFATAWVSSLLLPETIEEFYHEFRRQDAASVD